MPDVATAKEERILFEVVGIFQEISRSNMRNCNFILKELILTRSPKWNEHMNTFCAKLTECTVFARHTVFCASVSVLRKILQEYTIRSSAVF